MFKRVYLLTFLVITLFFGFSLSANAEEKTNNVVDWKGQTVETLKVNNGLVVKKLKDGRVLPVNEKKAHMLTDGELNKILLFMGEDPSNLDMPRDMKIDIVKNGGKVAESSSHKLTIEDYNEKGEKIFVREIDLDQSQNNNIGALALSSSTYQCFIGGCFNGRLTTYLVGTSGSNYKYSIYYRYDWNDFHSYYYTDRIGLAWTAKATKVAGSDYGTHSFYDNFGNYRSYKMSINKTSTYGTAMNVPMYSFNRQSGYQKVQLYYPTRYKGDYDYVAGSYGHNWQTIFNSISIGPASINISNTYKQFKLEKNLKVGY